MIAFVGSGVDDSLRKVRKNKVMCAFAFSMGDTDQFLLLHLHLSEMAAASFIRGGSFAHRMRQQLCSSNDGSSFIHQMKQLRSSDETAALFVIDGSSFIHQMQQLHSPEEVVASVSFIQLQRRRQRLRLSE